LRRRRRPPCCVDDGQMTIGFHSQPITCLNDSSKHKKGTSSDGEYKIWEEGEGELRKKTAIGDMIELEAMTTTYRGT